MSAEPLPVQVFLPRHLGDAVMALPALRRLAHATTVVVLADGVAAQAVRGQGSWTVRPSQDVRPGPAVLFAASLRVALAATRAGCRPRIGLASDRRGLLLDVRVAPPVEPLPDRVGGHRLPRLLCAEHQVAAYLRVAESALGALGTPVSPQSRREDSFSPDPRSRAAGEAMWTRLGRPRFVLHPFAAGSATKRWSASRWVSLAKRLGSCVITGGPGPDDAALASQIGTEAGVPTLAGGSTLPLGEWASLARLAEAVVAPDTGVAHLARAAGAHVVALFGSTDPARHAPRGPGRLTLLHGGTGLPCSPCYRPDCVEGIGGACMSNVEVPQVLEALGVAS